MRGPVGAPMVDFALSEEQEMLQELAREFATDEVRPHGEHWDATGTYPLDAIKAAHELGLMNLAVDEAYGGAGMGVLAEVVVNEQFAWGDPGFATAIYSNGLSSAPIITGGTDEQKARWLGMLCEAPHIAAYAITEPEAGSDVQALKTTAVRDGDEYVLSGNKMFITGAGQASWFFVVAYTDKSVGYKGMSAFVVEADRDGVQLGKKEQMMGQRASDTRSVDFVDCRVPADHLIGGQEGKGWFNAMAAFDKSRPNIAAHAVGIAQAALDHCLRYADERVTFGKKLHQHQAIQFMLADMATKIEAARLLTYKAAWLSDQGQPNTMAAAHAKRFAADTAMEVTTDAVQIFGGYGYSEEYPVARLMRAAKVMQIYEGSSQVQRMIIGRELTRSL